MDKRAKEELANAWLKKMSPKKTSPTYNFTLPTPPKEENTSLEKVKRVIIIIALVFMTFVMIGIYNKAKEPSVLKQMDMNKPFMEEVERLEKKNPGVNIKGRALKELVDESQKRR